MAGEDRLRNLVVRFGDVVFMYTYAGQIGVVCTQIITKPDPSPSKPGDGAPWELLWSPSSLSRCGGGFGFGIGVASPPLTIVLSISHRHSAFRMAAEAFNFSGSLLSKSSTNSWTGFE